MVASRVMSALLLGMISMLGATLCHDRVQQTAFDLSGEHEMHTKYYIQMETFEGAWFNYVDNSPFSFQSRERTEFYLGKLQAKVPERNLRIVADD